jgi:tRNA pseudouridine65 synthase
MFDDLAALPVRHLDDDFVVVAKPAGMLVHRDAHSKVIESYALQVVSTQLGRYIYPVHRIDRNTSGLLCFALSREMARALHETLASPASTKEYLVLVRGETPERFASDRPLKSTKGEPRPASTDFERLATFSRCSLLAARIATGRRHQIRRHLSHLAHQVIGDSSYGKGRINAWFREQHGLPRMFLHATRLHLAHPRSGVPIDLHEPLADDLRGFLSRLPDVDPGLLARW